jgi:hypothetical protein
MQPINLGSSELAGEDVNNNIPEMLAVQRIKTFMKHPNSHFINFYYDLVIERLLVISYMVSSVEPQFDSLRKVSKFRKIGRADLLIASISLAHQATLVTRNLRHFRQISHLSLENWVD